MDYISRIGKLSWIKLYKYLSEYRMLHTSNEEKTRRFIEGVFWIVRSGAQWRLLPKEYGDWNTVYHRFADWADKGVWYKMLSHFAADPDMEYIIVDSTILRAHACASGAIKKNMAIRKVRHQAVLEEVFLPKYTEYVMHWVIRLVLF